MARPGEGGSPASRHPTLCAAAIYVALAVVMVGGGLLPGKALSASDYLWTVAPWKGEAPAGISQFGSNPEQLDAITQYQPFMQYTRDALPSVPLWNPHIMAGRPYLADSISAVASPFSVPAYVLPFWWSLAVMAILKLVVAALGAYLLGRALDMRFAGALMSGLVYGFGFFAVCWLAWPRFSVFALLPWLLLLVDVVARRPGPATTAAFALVVGAQFLAGMPEASAAVVLATVAFSIWRVATGPSEERRPATLALGLGLLAGAGLAAVVLVPFVELLYHSYDYHWRSVAPTSPLSANYLLSVFLPDYWGRAPHTFSQTHLYAFVVDRAMYPSALALMLAGAAVAIRRERRRVALLALALVALALVIGLQPFDWTWSRFPVLKTMRANYLLVWFVLPVSLLAGWALDDLSSARVPRPRRVAVIAAVVLVTPVVWMALAGTLSLDRLGDAADLAWGRLQPQAVDEASFAVVRMSALLEWLLPAALAAGLLAARLRPGSRLSGRGFAVAALVLVAADLARIGAGINPIIPRSHAVQSATPAIRYLQSRSPSRVIGLASAFAPTLTPNAAMRYRLYDARGYDVPVDFRFGTFWNANVRPVLPGTPIQGPTTVAERTLRGLSLLSVADILQSPAEKQIEMPGLRVAYDGPDARIYANDRALPRAFVVHRQTVVDGGASALAAVSAAGFDGRSSVVTEDRLPGLAVGGVAPPPAGERASIVGDAGDRIVLDAVARRPGMLVLTDTFDSGWEASVDGRSAPIHRVDYMLRGVPIGAGKHRVELRYRPTSFTVGLALSGLTAVALAGAVILAWRRRT